MMRTWLIAVSLTVVVTACGEEADPKKTAQVLEWLERYYKQERFPGKGDGEFVAFSVRAEGNRLKVLVAIRSAIGAQRLRSMDTGQKVTYWALLACPPRGTAYWATKDPNHQLEIQLRGPSGSETDYVTHATCEIH